MKDKEKAVMTVKNEDVERLERKKGFSLQGLLIAVAVAAVLAVSIGSVYSSSMKKANDHNLRAQMEVYLTAVQNIMISNPNINRFTATNPANAADTLVGLMNSELDESTAITRCADNADSGLIGYTTRCLDPWKNPYGISVYWADKGTTYGSGRAAGDLFSTSDSVLTIAIVSAGANGTGGPAGVDGSNIDISSKAILSAANCVNNTDGKDDEGMIIQVVNGSATGQYFGMKGLGIGALKDKQWIYGVPTTTGGVLYDFANKSAMSGVTTAGSVAEYYNEDLVNAAGRSIFGG